MKVAGSDASYKVGEKTSYEIGRFELQNKKSGSEDKDIIVKSLKLKNASGLNLAETFSNVKVYRDSKVVSKSVTLDGKDMTIVFDDDVLASGKRGTYTIMAEVAQLGEVNKAVNLELKKTSELVANEKNSGFRVQTTTTPTLKVYTFKGGKVTFSNDSNMAKSVNGAPSATDVVIAKGTLTISEPVKLSKIAITATTGSANADVEKSIREVKFEIGGSTYDTVKSSCTASACTFTTQDDDIYVSKTSDVRVLVDIDGEAVADSTIKFGNVHGQSFTKN